MTLRLCCILCVAASLSGCARRDPASAREPRSVGNALPATGVSLVVYVKDAATGGSLEGASVSLVVDTSSPLFPTYKTAGGTDRSGSCRVTVPDPEIDTTLVRATKPGYVPTAVGVRLDDGPPDAITLALER